MNIYLKTLGDISDLKNMLHIINYDQFYMDKSRNLSVNTAQCSAKGLNWKKMALKRKIHGWDRMIMLNTGTALKYSNLGEVTTFLGK